MDKKIVSTSKFLSLVLRHRPMAIGVELDAEGWLDIDELIERANANGKALNRELLWEVVETNDKRRFTISDDGQRIRANQGHSIANVDLNLQPTQPPSVLYHGTIASFIDSIRSQGLQKRARNHVHLSADVATARKVGSRRGKPIILSIDAVRMFDEGYEFFLSANGVWLTDAVPSAFINFPDSAC